MSDPILAKTARGAGWAIGWRISTRVLGLLSTVILVPSGTAAKGWAAVAEYPAKSEDVAAKVSETGVLETVIVCAAGAEPD